ncbi:ABC transporter substrate-binding protein [Mesorhizobium sp. L-8-3]|uniref:ABC transporter substrate-binding protein n=1 Tax=Mesorhizobium sp. L-8-3 TaxID=2744522 RepID=UPI0019371C87|nr:ABC transporter substrate-binding protein [Mesorhizobium sp. L-8-3]BCH20665.1 ABC transporter substrate-binding protein [Mesorhizobium sp. L-8-3]
MNISRRQFVASSAILALSGTAPIRALAQDSGSIHIATLTPLTGAGGPYGPVMAQAVKAVVDQANASGGILGRQIQLVSEDDQTNPEAAVRAARKLIDVDKVQAIVGTWASAVTTAVAPLCWESKVVLATVSGADPITRLPHQGYLFRTQPNTVLQGEKFGQFCVDEGAKRVFFLCPQTPFVDTQYAGIKAKVEGVGGETKLLVYDDKKSSYRSEVDDMLAFKPDMVVLGGYMPDTTILLKDIFRSGYEGKKVAFAYSVNAKLIEGLPKEVVEGIYTIAPAPAEGSNGYTNLTKLIGIAQPDTYTCQVYDQINLILLAIAASGQATGTDVKTALRTVSQGKDGVKVSSLAEGLAALKDGKTIDYVGASGPCDFNDIGDIFDCQFRYEQVADGALKLIKTA